VSTTKVKQRGRAVQSRTRISEIIHHLKNYGLGELPHVSINRALEEARQILATIKGRSYGEADIQARTELSYARQSLNTVKDILYGQNELKNKRRVLDAIEAQVNDLLQYINTAMDKTRQASFLLRTKAVWRLNRSNRGVRSVGPVRCAGRFCSGLRGRRKTYLTILRRGWSANFKMVLYVLLRPLWPEQNRPARRSGPTVRTPLYQYLGLV
jgi:hypothetical protein